MLRYVRRRPSSYADEKTEEKQNYHRREVKHGSFSRTVGLPHEIDPNQVAASFENGMLKLTLHPTKAVERKKIPISA